MKNPLMNLILTPLQHLVVSLTMMTSFMSHVHASCSQMPNDSERLEKQPKTSVKPLLEENIVITHNGTDNFRVLTPLELEYDINTKTFCLATHDLVFYSEYDKKKSIITLKYEDSVFLTLEILATFDPDTSYEIYKFPQKKPI